MIDYHIHTHISGDCDASMMDMAAAAGQKGLREICFTEHIDLDVSSNIDFTIDFDAYRCAFSETRAAYPDITMRMGIEAGLEMRTKDEMKDIIAANDVDYVIGSQHIVFGLDPYEPDIWQQYDQRVIFDEYLRASIECVAACDFYDMVGHIGYISKFCPHDDKLMRYSDYRDAVDTLLKTIVQKGKGIEVNTNGLFSVGATMPEMPIITRYYELGGRIVTIGSDAHFTGHVGRGVPETLDVLKNIGFEYVCAFDKRKPRFIPIP